MHRLFVAIRPPEPIRDLLIDAIDESADFRWQSEDQLHLTLRFIGEVERPLANDLADGLKRVHANRFEICIKGAGAFDRRAGGTLWAAIEPRLDVASLAAKIERVCQENGVEPEHRAFHPHITLARWKGRRSREVRDVLERTRGLSSEPFMVAEFILFESRLSRHGAHYEPVMNYTLA
ncbi:MAG TPA: RNA 2',3'-cyclic phosphodiesterase [Sphingomicrobium sp.]|nr:RNA 2',3'-cyclic phosphodiesterase [Sphingomicrobium sp.]